MGIFGDFTVADSAFEYAQEENQERSEAAREADKAKRATITTDASRWANNKSGLDFPGVDTPSNDPDVLPKDLKQSQQPDRTARSRGEMPARVTDPTPSRNTEAPEVEVSRLSSQDISLAPEEAFEGVGATSSRELGGFNSSVGGEVSPLNDTTPDERAALEQNATQDISDVDALAGDQKVFRVQQRGLGYGVEDASTNFGRTSMGFDTKKKAVREAKRKRNATDGVVLIEDEEGSIDRRIG